MQASSFKTWLERVSLLNRRQRAQLLALLRPAAGLERVRARIEQARPYLPNYLGWRWALDGQRIDTAERMLQSALGAVLPNSEW